MQGFFFVGEKPGRELRRRLPSNPSVTEPASPGCSPFLRFRILQADVGAGRLLAGAGSPAALRRPRWDGCEVPDVNQDLSGDRRRALFIGGGRFRVRAEIAPQKGGAFQFAGPSNPKPLLEPMRLIHSPERCLPPINTQSDSRLASRVLPNTTGSTFGSGTFASPSRSLAYWFSGSPSGGTPCRPVG